MPSEELLEYLGTWDGDDEWLHTKEMLPASGRKATGDRAPAGRDQDRRKGERPTPEQ